MFYDTSCDRLRHDKFELIRYGLKKFDLIDDGPTLEERQCEKGWGNGNCYTCFTNHVCAKRVSWSKITAIVFRSQSIRIHLLEW